MAYIVCSQFGRDLLLCSADDVARWLDTPATFRARMTGIGRAQEVSPSLAASAITPRSGAWMGTFCAIRQDVLARDIPGAVYENAAEDEDPAGEHEDEPRAE